MKRFANFRILGRNKNEIYISVAATFVAAWFMGSMPHGYSDVLTAAGALAVAFFCALNAVLDIPRMNWLERIVAVAWFCFVACAAPAVILGIAQMGVFADR